MSSTPDTHADPFAGDRCDGVGLDHGGPGFRGAFGSPTWAGASGMLTPIPHEARATGRVQVRIAALLDEALALLAHDPSAARAAIVNARSLAEPALRAASRFPKTSGGCVLPTWRARQIAEFVDANIGRTLYSAELAGAAKMSTGQLARALKATYDLAPSEYVMQRRLTLAQRLMAETDLALAQIAQLCGLCDQAHLSRAFRKAFGQTPAAWRRGAKV